MKTLAVRLLLGWIVVLGGRSAMMAQQTAYSQTNLTANVSGVANHTDPQLSNPWGIAFVPGQAFWVSNNNGGTSTLYDDQGNKQSLVVTIPGASTNPCNPGCPTGIVANTSTDFGGGFFIFDSEDGIVTSWTASTSAAIVVDNSAAGAVYKGLALVSNSGGNFLLAANFNSGKIDVFDRNFNPAQLSGSFTDPTLPAGFAPHGVHVINNQVYVTYGQQDAAKHDPVPGAGAGQVDIFDVNGNFIKTFATGGTLNAPWGVVTASASFGEFSNDILVGNFGDGTINAFDSTGKSLGQVEDTNGKPIVNPGLWDMVFGAGGTGDPNTLYFTAGGSTQTSGLFASLVPATAVTNADFALSLSAQTATLTQGGSTKLSVSASGVGGFNSPISLACSAGSGITCTLTPSTITPGSSAASSTLTLTAASTPPVNGYGKHGTPMALLVSSGVGLFGLVVAGKRGQAKSTQLRNGLAILGLLIVTSLVTFTVACGGGNSAQANTPSPSSVTVMVTGTSGTLSHSVPLTLTVN